MNAHTICWGVALMLWVHCMVAFGQVPAQDLPENRPPPPLKISTRDVPVPLDCPFTNKSDQVAYREIYRFAYLQAATNQLYILMRSWCFGAETSNRTARIRGGYDGFRAGANERERVYRTKLKKRD